MAKKRKDKPTMQVHKERPMREFSEVADRVERNLAAWEASQKATVERYAIVAPLNEAVAERERSGQTSATPERILRAGAGAVEIVGQGEEGAKTVARVQRVNAAPLDRLWRAGTIAQREYEAGDDWRATAYLAAVDASAMTVDWSRAGGGGRSSRVPAVLTVEAMASASITRRRYERYFRRGTIVRDVLDRALVKEQSLEQIGRDIFGSANDRDAGKVGLGALRASLGALADWQGR